MKRWLILLILFLIITPAAAFWQSRDSNYNKSIASSLDPATSAWIAQVVTNGGSVSGGRQTIVNTFITCLKSASLFTTFDRYWLFAGENSASALTDMVGLSSATNVSSFPFTANVGVGPSNTVSYIDTGLASPTQCTQNSCAFGGQDQTASVTGNYAIFGAANGAFTQVSQYKPLTGILFNEVRINSGNGLSVAVVNAQGSIINARTGSTSSASYLNGSSLGTDATASVGLPGVAYFIGGINQAGGLVASNTTDIVSSFFLASGWNGTQAANFETCQNAMMTSIGINVH